MFLTMFGEKLNGTDPEEVIRNAFACFDEEGTGRTKFLLMPLLNCLTRCLGDIVLFKSFNPEGSN